MGFGQTTTKGRRFPAEILSNDEVKALLSATSKRGSCGVRDRAMIAVMYRGGLRVSEMLALYAKDIDLATGAVRVLDGKGHKARVVGIDGQAIALVVRWLERRAKLGLNGRQPLFCTLEGGELARSNVSQHLKALAVRAGIEKRVHPHGLRHSRAVDLMQGGVPVPIIQRALGHASLATTAVYLAHIAPTDVIAAMQEGEW